MISQWSWSSDSGSLAVRIKRKANERPSAKAKPKAPNRRRELYESVVNLQRTTHQRLQTFTREHRKPREERWLQTARLTTSCDNRLQTLQCAAPALEEGAASASPAQLTMHMLAQAKSEMTDKWSQLRKQRAWSHHDQLVENILAKEHWYETTVAGMTRDIRLVHSRSPFDEHVWTWPCQDQGGIGTTKQEPVEEPASAVDVFTFGLADPTASVPPPLPDRDASRWWRAHCTQSQLKLKAQDGPSWTSEALMNQDLHQLVLETKRRAEADQHAAAVLARADRLQQDVNQQIRAIELQIELNTRMTREMAMRKQAAKKRLSREQQAAVSIQRHVRGAHGRKKAEEIRCEFFVMVRGRAIRKGKCEECGAQPAVLQCKECEESVHFCPMCWVHVHSTRRRKMHMAIPMAVPVMAKEPAPEVKPSTVPSRRPRASHQPGVAQLIALRPERSAPVATIVQKSLELSAPSAAALAIPVADTAKVTMSDQPTTQHVRHKPSDSANDGGSAAAEAVPASKQAPKPKAMPKSKSGERSAPVAARPSLKARHSALAKAREDQKNETNPSLIESETAPSAAEEVLVAASVQPEQPMRKERDAEALIVSSQATAMETPAASLASERQEPAAPTHAEPSVSEMNIAPSNPEPQQEEAAHVASIDPVDDPNATSAEPTAPSPAQGT